MGGGVDLGRGSWPRAEHTEQRHHDDRLDVDVAEAARLQVARHPPATPVEQRRGLGPERWVLQRGIDPDAQHRRLVRVGGVVAPEPPAQRRCVPDGSSSSDTSGISSTAAPTACTAARSVSRRASWSLFRKYR